MYLYVFPGFTLKEGMSKTAACVGVLLVVIKEPM
jgi:hypothetical protein